MEQQVIDRRVERRFPMPSQANARATLRPGCPVELVDISAGGALVDAPRPLRPGARVHVQVATPQRAFAIAAHVMRCMVWAVAPLEGIRYRGALRFDHRIEWSWGQPARLGMRCPSLEDPQTAQSGTSYPFAR